VPADAQDNDLSFEMSPFEQRRTLASHAGRSLSDRSGPGLQHYQLIRAKDCALEIETSKALGANPVPARLDRLRFSIEEVEIPALLEDFQSDNVFLDPLTFTSKSFFDHKFQKTGHSR